ncbi:MAG: zinc transporter [Bacteroidetes bacterium]|nr:MAG: zinc transporter [Bacteroidota bacterium]
MTLSLVDLLHDYTFQVIAVGTTLIGLLSGVLGSFAVLRGQSLLGDAISHAALPGIALIFLFTGIKDSTLFLVGAAASGLLGALWITSIVRNTKIKTDTALGVVLSVFFGFGIMLLTFIQKRPNANQAGLETYLFGQAATLLIGDVVVMGVAAVVIFLLVFLFWKELKIITFDIQYASTQGVKTQWMDIGLTFLIVCTIVLGLQAVGVVLMSALLIAPAAAARQWTNRLEAMVLLSACFGGLSGFLGTLVSSLSNHIATGPVIVLICVSFTLISFVFAPERGFLAKYRLRKQQRRLLLHKMNRL